MNHIRSFKNAREAFETLYEYIHTAGVYPDNGTLAIYNAGFLIENPMDNLIDTPFRKWSNKYAEREFKWYLSENRSVEELKKYAPIWDRMHGGDNIVNSNYGWQWNRNGQLDKICKQLIEEKATRQAWVSIYDGKEKDDYLHDTPCTIGIGFRVVNYKVDMTVIMRSNDLWYGFCNDQYCFSHLQEMVCNMTGYGMGTYFHYADDMHLYEDQLNKHIL